MLETMKAVRFSRYGGPEVLTYEDVPRPAPAADEVLVRVHAAGVNPVDAKIREGHLQEMLGHVLPLIPGWDLAGVVERPGEAVAHWRKGEAVYARPNLGLNGAYAQFIVVHESELAPKPSSLDYIHAAAVPMAGLTAWQALFEAAELKSGQRVLIHGASGAVGSMAVQLAHWKGAYVVGTASAKNREYVDSLGADEVIDYNAEAFEQSQKDIDVVLDTVGEETTERSWKVLRKGGILVGLTARPSAEQAERHGVRQTIWMSRADGVQLIEIGKLIDDGKLKVLVERELPLSHAAEAQELSQSSRARGKIVLHIS